MKAFWRDKPLSPIELELISVLGDAHYKSTFRQNPSSIALQCAAQGSGEFLRSIATALLTFGDRHGPIEKTYLIIADDKWDAKQMVNSFLFRKEKVPGWGSTFTKESLDPFWVPVETFLLKHYELISARMSDITGALEQTGRKVLPNPSAFTAAAAIALEMPRRLAPYLLVVGRIVAWSEIFLNETKGH